jgi:hypothetical protein
MEIPMSFHALWLRRGSGVNDTHIGQPNILLIGLDFRGVPGVVVIGGGFRKPDALAVRARDQPDPPARTRRGDRIQQHLTNSVDAALRWLP